MIAAAAGSAGQSVSTGAGSGPGSVTAGAGQPGPGAPLAGFAGHATLSALGWRDAAVAGALAIVAAGILVAWRASRLPVMSSRYDRAPDPAPTDPAPLDPAALDPAAPDPAAADHGPGRAGTAAAARGDGQPVGVAEPGRGSDRPAGPGVLTGGLPKFITAYFLGGTLFALVTLGVLMHPAVARAFGVLTEPQGGELREGRFGEVGDTVSDALGGQPAAGRGAP